MSLDDRMLLVEVKLETPDANASFISLHIILSFLL